MLLCSSDTTWQGEPDKPFIEASTGHVAKQQEHKQYRTTHADQTYRQNTQANNKTKTLPVSIEMLPAVQTAWSFCWMQMPVLFLHNSHLITGSDSDLCVYYV
jgi:hypothetical protein